MFSGGKFSRKVRVRGRWLLLRYGRRGMAKVVAEGYSFGEVFVEAERAGYGARSASSRGCGSGVEVISVGSDEYLGLVHEAAEGLAWIMRSLSRWNSLRTPSGASGLWRPALDSQAHVPLMPGVCVWGFGLWEERYRGREPGRGSGRPAGRPRRALLRRLARIGVSIMALSRSNVPGASGRRRPALLAEHAAEVRGEVQGLGGLVEARAAAQTVVELRGVAGEHRELQAEGRLDGTEAGVAALQGVEAVVEEVEYAAVCLVAPGEGAHAPDHAGCCLEAGEVLTDAVEAAQHLGLGHCVEGTAVVGDEVHARERFEAGAEAGPGAPDTLSDGRDEPCVSSVEVEDAPP